ncbi:MAG: Tol-Pal system beta propeller repeat protein TolB [Rhodobacteraceae bacterium]|nr:Tol-Pal system beta propeller repeat protein TolB [Paracoccaceae bacterium]
MLRVVLALVLLAIGSASVAQERGPLRIEITEGVIEPVPIAVPDFLTDDPALAARAAEIAGVVRADLAGSGLFRPIPADAFISQVTNLDSPVQYADWQAINAQGLVTGKLIGADGKYTVQFRLFDIFAETTLGEGLQFTAADTAWRRLAHKVADAVYSRITGEGGYFDSRVVFVAESGPKDARDKRLAIMDYDGANTRYLTQPGDIVLAPRISRDGGQVLYTSYATGRPRVTLIETETLATRVLDEQPGSMTFSPRFTPDGQGVLLSLSERGNTDLYRLDLAGGARTRLTEAPSIETAPSFAPDGERIVFESDRSGNQQLYVMAADGSGVERISFGPGRYGTPVWSPKGDLIAFTKQHRGRFHIGVMRPDGSEERLLTASFLDESPTWAPNGRVLMFTRETPGAAGGAQLFSVDVTGRNLRPVPTPGPASDPAWSPLQE